MFTGSLSEEEDIVKDGVSDSGSEKEEGRDESEGDEEENEWNSLQQTMKIQQQKKKESGANRESHPIHSPFFPDVSHMIIMLVT